MAESEAFKLLWDFISGQYDRVVEVRRPDIIFLDKQAREAKIIDIAIPVDAQVKNRERE